MATPKRHDVTCPVCSHTQREYVEATSTFCHACGHRYSTAEKPARRVTRSARSAAKLQRQRVLCLHCSQPLQIPDASDSWQCPFCSEYLDLKNHIINHSVGRSVLTYGDVVIESKGFFSGNRAEGKDIRIAGGTVSGQLKARELLEISRPSKISAELRSDRFHITAGGKVNSRKSLHCREAVIEGNARFRSVGIIDSLLVKAGGVLHTDELSAGSILVEPGGTLTAKNAACPKHAKQNNVSRTETSVAPRASSA